MTIKEQLRSLFILLRKEVLRFFRIWSQTLIPSVLTTILYFLIFGFFYSNNLKSASFKVRYFYSLIKLSDLASPNYAKVEYPVEEHSTFGFFKNMPRYQVVIKIML